MTFSRHLSLLTMNKCQKEPISCNNMAAGRPNQSNQRYVPEGIHLGKSSPNLVWLKKHRSRLTRLTLIILGPQGALQRLKILKKQNSPHFWHTVMKDITSITRPKLRLFQLCQPNPPPISSECSVWGPPINVACSLNCCGFSWILVN